jgi:hypothetical protein
MLDYFLFRMRSEIQDKSGSVEVAKKVLKDIKAYYGHEEVELCLEPMLAIILDQFYDIS